MDGRTLIHHLKDTPTPQGFGLNGQEIMLAQRDSGFSPQTLGLLRQSFTTAAIITDQDNLAAALNELNIVSAARTRIPTIEFTNGEDVYKTFPVRLNETIRQSILFSYPDEVDKYTCPNLERQITKTFQLVGPIIDTTKELEITLLEINGGFRDSWHTHFEEKIGETSSGSAIYAPSPHKISIVRCLSAYGTEIALKDFTRREDESALYTTVDQAVTSGQGHYIFKGPTIHRSPLLIDNRWIYAIGASLKL